MILGSHLERLPEDERAPFVDDVLAQMGDAGARELRAAQHPRTALSTCSTRSATLPRTSIHGG